MLLDSHSVYEPQRKWKLPHSATSEMLVVVKFCGMHSPESEAPTPAVSKTGKQTGKSWVCVKAIRLRLNVV